MATRKRRRHRAARTSPRMVRSMAEQISWVAVSDGRCDGCDGCERPAVIVSLGHVSGRVFRSLCQEHAPAEAIAEAAIPLPDREPTVV